MLLVSTSRRMWLIGMGVSLIIFGVLYFTVIKPSSDTANQAVKQGLQQSQQALNQASKQLQNAGAQTSSASSQASGVSSQASQQLSKAAQLTSCLSTAGTDVAKVETCQAKFGK